MKIMNNIKKINKKMTSSVEFLKIAVIYLRDFDKETFASPSLEGQERACREFALKQGYRITRVFIDHNQSGRSFNRPEFQALINACSSDKKGIKAVIVFNANRLSTSLGGLRQMRFFFRRHKIKLILVSDSVAKQARKQPRRPR